MDLSNLTPAKGSTRNNKRLGRGQGSGRGGTSTRGHKGAGSRSGTAKKIGFEGGQMPLQRRLPKFGFRNPNRVEYKAINLSVLQALVEKSKQTTITFESMVECGLVSKNELVKILATGELTSKIEVSAHAFSQKAAEIIEAKGGKVVKL